MAGANPPGRKYKKYLNNDSTEEIPDRSKTYYEQQLRSPNLIPVAQLANKSQNREDIPEQREHENRPPTESLNLNEEDEIEEFDETEDSSQLANKSQSREDVPEQREHGNTPPTESLNFNEEEKIEEWTKDSSDENTGSDFQCCSQDSENNDKDSYDAEANEISSRDQRSSSDRRNELSHSSRKRKASEVDEETNGDCDINDMSTDPLQHNGAKSSRDPVHVCRNRIEQMHHVPRVRMDNPIRDQYRGAEDRMEDSEEHEEPMQALDVGEEVTYSFYSDEEDECDDDAENEFVPGDAFEEELPQHGPQDNPPEQPEPPVAPLQSHVRLRQRLLTQEFTSPLTTSVSVSVAEALLMTLSVARQNNLSYKAFVDIVKLQNSIFVTPVLPKSAFLLDNLLNPPDGVKRYFYCEKCFHSFGNIDHIAHPVNTCPECGLINSMKDLTKATYFVLYDVPSQIEDLFMDRKNWESLVDPKTAAQQSDRDELRDLYDGSCYKNCVSSLPDLLDVIILSFVCCTDGSPLFKSSNFSIWPFFLSINELPPLLRMLHLLLGGIWYGNKKPPMDLFLEAVVNHLKLLSITGFEICVNNEIIKMRAYTLACCVDSGARGAVQGLNTHSGYYSCNWCEVPGEYCDNKVVFPHQQNPPKLRTHYDIVQYATECVADKSLAYVYGVQYLTPLAQLPKFDLVNGMVQDFTHNVPFGIARSFLVEWISNTSKGFYIGSPDDIHELDLKISLLTPPIEVRKSPRVISDHANWNAREFENFIILFSLAVLIGILPSKFWVHWSYAVQATYLLSRKTVTKDDVNNAHILLQHFISAVEMLYGKRFMTYNLHILGHLAQNTARWGPTWAVSMYCFESGIGDLKALLHAQRGVPHQIHRALNYRRAEHILRNTCLNPKTECFLESIKPKPNKMTKYLPLEECVLLGSSMDFVPNAEERFVLRQTEYDIDVSNSALFKKIIACRCVYTIDEVSLGKKFCDSYALCSSGQIVVIKKFLLDKTNDRVFVFCVDVCCEVFLKMPQGVQLAAKDHCMRVVSSIGRRLKLISVRELQIVCVKTVMNDKTYVTPFPQLYNVF